MTALPTRRTRLVRRAVRTAPAVLAAIHVQAAAAGPLPDPTPLSPPPFPATREAPDAGAAPHAEEPGPVELGFPDPHRFLPASAGRALAEYLSAWHTRRFATMALWATPQWRRVNAGERLALLRRGYGARRLRGWVLRSSHVGTDRATFRVELAYRTLLDPRVRRAVETVLLERQATAGGGQRWGVRPVPAATVTTSPL